jgi:hypothetical protein
LEFWSYSRHKRCANSKLVDAIKCHGKKTEGVSQDEVVPKFSAPFNRAEFFRSLVVVFSYQEQFCYRLAGTDGEIKRVPLKSLMQKNETVSLSCGRDQGCQMAHFKTKNPSLGKFWRVLQLEYIGIFYVHLVYFTAIWYILWQLGIFCGNLVYFIASSYVFSRFGKLYQEKSGNPGPA